MRLKYHTPLAVSVAIKHACFQVVQERKYNNTEKGWEEDKKLIERVGEAVRKELIEQ